MSKLLSLFAWFGIPEELITAHSLPNNSSRTLCLNMDVEHTTSSPYYPQANGLAERVVGTAKSILRQLDPQFTLLSYRDTATELTKESPTRLLMGKRLQTTIPELNNLLVPAWPDLSTMKQNNAKAKKSLRKQLQQEIFSKATSCFG